eukprot:CAMPEP_0170076886 /NCGR_PEP_ID=MMETSP0019_2-20121128/13815_1 /TAXON_ID=98059 /ORGANISM="Dinobryon sp., Strain UTEXLB2267" /LENGTH=357 /DNA_ID=CAMNT_0010288887 /DNA_START=575 /DNA_END=1648 /DNA_ORIENTATION=+
MSVGSSPAGRTISTTRMNVETAGDKKLISLSRKNSDLNNVMSEKNRIGSSPPPITSSSRLNDTPAKSIQVVTNNETENNVDMDDDDDDEAPSNSNTPVEKGLPSTMMFELPKDSSSDLGSEVSNVEEIKISSARFLSFNNLSMNRSMLPVNNNEGSEDRTLDQCADVVIFMGDLNYRIKGNRSIVDRLLESNMHEVLLKNDQLRCNMEKCLVLQNFVEPPLNFRPTYKLDVGTDNTYDTGPKNRIPAWTDRILYKDAPCLECLAYNADFSINTSDHKPVYATFAVDVDLNDSEKQPQQLKQSTTMSSSLFISSNRIAVESSTTKMSNEGDVSNGKSNPMEPLAHPPFSSESQVCLIM